jgi:dTMP kinase
MESTLAYQGAMGLPMDWLIELHRFVPRPDLTIILDVPVNVAMSRLSSRRRLEVFEINRDFLERVRELLLRRALELNYPVINGERDVNAVVDEVFNIVIKHLGHRINP